jgi:PPOX class probable F420-dependent enzyme
VTETVPGWAMDLLREGRVARLGTADAGGRPLVVPVCYAFDGTQLYSAIDPKPKRTRRLRRVRNLEENPQCSLVVDVWDEEWSRLRWVIVEGRAELLSSGADYARGISLLIGKYPQYRTLGLDQEHGTLIRLTPERYLHWSYA